MKTYELTLTSDPSTSFRCTKAANSLDIDIDKKPKHHFKVAAAVMKDYNVGLVVGASGSGKTTIAKQIFGNNAVCAALRDLIFPVMMSVLMPWLMSAHIQTNTMNGFAPLRKAVSTGRLRYSDPTALTNSPNAVTDLPERMVSMESDIEHITTELSTHLERITQAHDHVSMAERRSIMTEQHLRQIPSIHQALGSNGERHAGFPRHGALRRGPGLDRFCARGRNQQRQHRDVAEFDLVAWLTVGRPAELIWRWALLVAAFSFGWSLI